MAMCSMCGGLSVVPKYWWTDFFWTKTCPVCNGSGQVRVQQEVPIPLKPVETPPAKGGDIVAGIAFMVEKIVEHTEERSNVIPLLRADKKEV